LRVFFTSTYFSETDTYRKCIVLVNLVQKGCFVVVLIPIILIDNKQLYSIAGHSDYALLYSVILQKYYNQTLIIMTKFYLLFIGLILADMLNAQVGINTKNPVGVFHIDGKMDNDPVPTTNQQLNDVVVLANGNMGVGTVNPETKFVIESGSTSANPMSAFRIVDGNEGENKVMTAIDNTGRATWQDLPLSFKTGQVFGTITIKEQVIQPSVVNDLGFSYTVTEAGYYAFEIRWWAEYNTNGITTMGGNETASHFYLRKNGVDVDAFEAYTTINIYDVNRLTVYVPLYSNAQVGDIFTLFLRPGYSPQNQGMATNNAANRPWTHSKVTVKLMDL
jgi:hypothetical protein